jgi:polyisoprenoid-binding protein YceI
VSSTVQQSLPTGTWQADPIHSSASFRVKHFGVSTFRANFGTIDATYGPDGLVGAVPVESISITQPDFRGHLLAEDFFHAEQHPSSGSPPRSSAAPTTARSRSTAS